MKIVTGVILFLAGATTTSIVVLSAYALGREHQKEELELAIRQSWTAKTQRAQADRVVVEAEGESLN